MPCARVYLLALSLNVGASGIGVSAEPITVARISEELRAANDARGRQGSEIQAWKLESDRLSAAADGLRAELARIQAELAAAESIRSGLKGEHERLGAGDAAKAQQILAEAAAATRARIQALATTLPPGALIVPADDGLDSVLRAIEQSQHQASQVAVEVSAGHLVGDPADKRTAVRLLRAASLMWWASLDGDAAGTATVDGNGLQLAPLSERGDIDTIRRAVAIAEGRAAAEPVALPRPATTGGAAP